MYDRSTRRLASLLALVWSMIGFAFVAVSCSTEHGRAASNSDSVVSAKTDQAALVTPRDTAAVRSFVAGFYEWYVPLAHKESSQPTWYVVLDRRPFVLSDSLLHALKRDRDAQAKAVGEIAGIDFDPFLSAQDPCDRYVTGDSVRTGPVYRVNVYGVCGSSRHARPDVVALVARRDTSWVLVDFEYPLPKGGNLLGILARTGSTTTK